MYQIESSLTRPLLFSNSVVPPQEVLTILRSHRVESLTSKLPDKENLPMEFLHTEVHKQCALVV